MGQQEQVSPNQENSCGDKGESTVHCPDGNKPHGVGSQIQKVFDILFPRLPSVLVNTLPGYPGLLTARTGLAAGVKFP